MITDRLIEETIKKQNPTALGLDTRLEYLPKSMLKNIDISDIEYKDACNLILEYNTMLIDELAPLVPAVKIQIAYYEMYGTGGIKAYYKTINYAKSKGLIVIADAKRNDIGATCTAYANAFIGTTPMLNKNPFDADFVTVTPYLGSDGITPFIDVCKEKDKGIFVLVKTSNPSSGEIQDLIVEGQPLYMKVGEMVKNWGSEIMGKYGYSACGAVVGATYKEQAKALRAALDTVYFLIPGYGAQGAKGSDIVTSFDNRGLGGIVNASRSIICAHTKEQFSGMKPMEAAREATLLMKEDLLCSLKDAGKELLKSM